MANGTNLIGDACGWFVTLLRPLWPPCWLKTSRILTTCECFWQVWTFVLSTSVHVLRRLSWDDLLTVLGARCWFWLYSLLLGMAWFLAIKFWSKVENARAYAGLSTDLPSAVEEKWRMLGDVVRNVSIILAEAWTPTVTETKVKNASVERQLTPVEAAQPVGLTPRQEGLFLAGWRRRELVHRPFCSSGPGDSSTVLRRFRAVFHRRRRGRHGDRRSVLDKFRLGIGSHRSLGRTAARGGGAFTRPATSVASQVRHAGQRAARRPPAGRKATRANKSPTWIPNADGCCISRGCPGRTISCNGPHPGGFSRRRLSRWVSSLWRHWHSARKSWNVSLAFGPPLGTLSSPPTTSAGLNTSRGFAEALRRSAWPAKKSPPTTAGRSHGRLASGSRRRTRTSGTSGCDTRQRPG